MQDTNPTAKVLFGPLQILYAQMRAYNQAGR